MPWLLLLIQIALAVVFVAAAAGKALRADEFAAALRLSHLPEPVVRPLAALVPALEVALAFWLVLAAPRALPLAFAAAAALLAAFTVWLGWVRARGLRVRCGCFGLGGGVIGPAALGRNTVLLGLALVGWGLASRVATPQPGPTWETGTAALAAGLAVALIQAGRLVWPELAVSFDRLQRQQAAEGEL